MSDFIAYPIFFFLIAVTLLLAILISRNVCKTGVEHFSGRMLILFAILNAFLCTLLLLSQTISNSSLSTSSRVITGFLAIIIPIRVLWNYFTGSRSIISRFNLQSTKNKTVMDTITSLSKSMEIAPPVIFSSDSVKTPFVFGRRSADSYLAIPSQWNNFNNSTNYPVLLHEMAHIRNHDVGFLAWAQAFTRDFKWFVIIFPLLIAFGYALQHKQAASSLCIYLTCLFALYGLLKYILRKRESLADRTAALLIESSLFKHTVTLHSEENINSITKSAQGSKSRFGTRLHRWLADKALFSKHPKRWTAILRVSTFFRLTHPERSKRIDNISTTNEKTANPQITLGDSFWAGIMLGFWGIAIGLCGYWFTGPINYDPEDVECLHLSYNLYWIVLPPTVGFWVTFVTLGFWSSLRNPDMDKTFFKLLLKRHCAAFGGAFIVSLLILTAGLMQLHFQVLTVLCILWQFMVMLGGFCVSIISVFLWGVTRYFQASTVKNLKKTFGIFIPVLVITLTAVFVGMFLIANNHVLQGTNLILSILIGCVIFKVATNQSKFSEPDQYMTLSFVFLTCQIEGKAFLRWSKFYDVVVFPLFLLFPSALTYWLVWWLFHHKMADLKSHWAIILLSIIGCLVIVLIQLSERGKPRIARRPKIHRLFHCLRLLSKLQSTENLNKIARVANSYGLKKMESFNRPLNLTTGDVYELYHFSKLACSDLCKRAIEWALQCQQPGGFNLWPRSEPRLVSTYQALSILKDSGRLDRIDPSGHISWIKSCQQPDGSFRSPWSKRDIWEDTFFATQSLNFLHASFETDSAKLCGQWAHGILQDGFVEDNPNKVYHSTGILEALGQTDEYTSKMTSDWLFGKVEKLLLTNIGLNYENVHFIIMTYARLSRRTPLISITPQIKLLANRIQAALEAELADIHS